ncbi:hypothetical protein M0638_13690 [Roseomonas sp. NAR14]|uniref:Uncharacterized protein n=1 Tax=Roseomonas acroporae TaxID=2937791 RepID=A0A9X1Y969_9PROT|nr:hypothetical protein [Roseomonas acroporae]MCK8785437.1 hypothetical protein [Roseomonas acroporae]
MKMRQVKARHRMRPWTTRSALLLPALAALLLLAACRTTPMAPGGTRERPLGEALPPPDLRQPAR